MRLLFVVMLISSSCFPQQYIKAGLTLSQTSQTPPYGSIHQRIAGLTAGIAFHRQWTDRVAIRPEMLFIQKGDRLTTSTEELKMRLNYIEIPVIAVLSLMKEPHPVMLALEVGPSFGYGLGGNYKLTSPSSSQEGGVIFGERDPNVPTQAIYLPHPIDIGIQLGGAITVRQRLLCEIRYGLGFTTLTDPPDPLPTGTTSSDYLMMNGVLQFSLGWMVRKESGN